MELLVMHEGTLALLEQVVHQRKADVADQLGKLDFVRPVISRQQYHAVRLLILF